MSKFNVGDRVVIREWDDMEEEYGLTSSSSINCNCYFTTGMRYLCGREFTIRALDDHMRVLLSLKKMMNGIII